MISSPPARRAAVALLLAALLAAAAPRPAAALNVGLNVLVLTTPGKRAPPKGREHPEIRPRTGGRAILGPGARRRCPAGHMTGAPKLLRAAASQQRARRRCACP
jgi:hypothetical protein